MKNTILRGNGSPQYIGDRSDGKIDISYSNVQKKNGEIVLEAGAINWLTGNIDADPLFCNPWDSDYHLAENSPSANSGSSGSYMGAFEVGCPLPVEIEESEELPFEFQLWQNYPNPFNPSTSIRYSIPEISDVNLTIYDVRGRTILTHKELQKSVGEYEFTWNGTDARGLGVPTGIYFCRLDAGSTSRKIKMLLLR